MTLASEKETVRAVIEGGKEAWSWLSKMQDVQRRLVQNGADDLELSTKHLLGSWVEVSFKGTIDDPELGIRLQEEYKWDRNSMKKTPGGWQVYLKRRYKYP